MLSSLFRRKTASQPKSSPFQERRPSSRWAATDTGKGRRTVRVAEVVRETPSAVSLVLNVEGEFSWQAGQYLTVIVDIDGVSLRRAYSLSSPPGAGFKPTITVKRVPDGVVSNYINDRVEPGDSLQVLGPHGEFTVQSLKSQDSPASLDDAVTNKRFKHDTRFVRFLLIGGGSGITPLIAIAEATLRNHPDSDVVLLYGNKCEREIIFRERLDQLALSNARFRVKHVLEDSDADWAGECGFITPDAIATLATEDKTPTATAYFVCGPEPLMNTAERALLDAGVSAAQIKLERFTFAARPSADRPTAGFPVRFTVSNKQIAGTAGRTLLDSGLAAGVEMPFSCTMGGCGACKVKVTTGSVVMDEPNCLTEAEASEGYVLACCAYPAADLSVEI